MFKTLKKIFSNILTLSTLLLFVSMLTSSEVSDLHGLIRIEPKNKHDSQTSLLSFADIIKKPEKCKKVKNIYITTDSKTQFNFRTKCLIYASQYINLEVEHTNFLKSYDAILIIVPTNAILKVSEKLLRAYYLLTISPEGDILNVISSLNCEDQCTSKQITLKGGAILIFSNSKIKETNIPLLRSVLIAN